jgi:hypothetical protein
VARSSEAEDVIMRGLVLFVAGILVGVTVQTGIAQRDDAGIVGLNPGHVMARAPGSAVL